MTFKPPKIKMPNIDKIPDNYVDIAIMIVIIVFVCGIAGLILYLWGVFGS